MKTIYQARLNCGVHLRELRMAREMSLRALEMKCGVGSSSVSAMESGDKVIGPDVAMKLADGLGVRGEERDEFLLKAAATRKRDQLMGYARTMPSEVLNYLPRALNSMGVGGGSIENCRCGGRSGLSKDEPAVAAKLLEAGLKVASSADEGDDGDVLIVDTDNGQIACTLVMTVVE